MSEEPVSDGSENKEDEYASFSTVCPYCKKEGQLYVVHFTANTAIHLSKDGFAVTDSKFFDTTDEVVHCKACDKEFSLAEVTL